MKKLKFILPVLVVLLAGIGAFATNKWGNDGVKTIDVDVTCNASAPCPVDGVCSGSGSTCAIGSCVTLNVRASALSCSVPALGSFRQP